MSFLKDRFFLLNTFKNFLIFATGIWMFLNLFDFIFSPVIEWLGNLTQGLFLAFILILLNNFADFRKLKSISLKASLSQHWRRNAMIDGSADLSLESIVSYLEQDIKVFDIKKVNSNKATFRLRYNAYLTYMEGEININDNIVNIQLTNNGFLHFGASSSINLHALLARMEVYFHP